MRVREMNAEHKTRGRQKPKMFVFLIPSLPSDMLSVNWTYLVHLPPQPQEILLTAISSLRNSIFHKTLQLNSPKFFATIYQHSVHDYLCILQEAASFLSSSLLFHLSPH